MAARPVHHAGMTTYRIACIPGDGIGKEVVPAGQQVLQALADAGGPRFEFTSFGWGGDWYRAHGEMMPADGLDQLAAHVARHLFQEAVCRAGDSWPGEESPGVHPRPKACTTCGGEGP